MLMNSTNQMECSKLSFLTSFWS